MYPERIEIDSMGRRTVYVLRRDLTGESTPVYELEGSGVQARPNGGVWIRFAEGTDASSRAADIESAGYRIERIPGYTTSGAFLIAADVASALSGLDALRAIPGVEAVEPQMLMERSFR
jgi:hypothetical protein